MSCKAAHLSGRGRVRLSTRTDLLLTPSVHISAIPLCVCSTINSSASELRCQSLYCCLRSSSLSAHCLPVPTCYQTNPEADPCIGAVMQRASAPLLSTASPPARPTQLQPTIKPLALPLGAEKSTGTDSLRIGERIWTPQWRVTATRPAGSPNSPCLS
jgi:hypothetical protein